MAKFTTRLDNNFCFLSHNTSTAQSSILLNRTSRKNIQLQLSPSEHRFNFKVLCSIKEKENVKGEIEKVGGGASSGGLVNGVRVEELDRKTGLGRENASKEAGFDLVWPPWKNIPQRYKLIGTTSLAFVICNMDKVNLSVAIIPMSHQFGWNSSVAGVVQSSFFWGYALSQLPGGWLSKLFGGRKVLEIGVLAWSLATALVPVLAGFMPGLLLSRVLVGIGEGVSPSAATDLIARHYIGQLKLPGHGFTTITFQSIPLEERSRAVSFVFGGLSVGSVTGLLVAPTLIQNLGWESVFYLFGLVGIWWYLGFHFLGEGRASDAVEVEHVAPLQSANLHKSWNNSSEELAETKTSWSNTQEELRASLKDVPWKAFFRRPAVWAMIYAHFCGSWGHYTCLSWLPTFFSEELNLNLREAAWVSILPPLASVFVTSIAAQFADNLIANGVETTTVRKICQAISFLSPATCMILSSLDLGLQPWEIVGILSCGLALSSFALSGLYCTHQDISPEYASILLGITNTVGAVPGIVGVALTGFLLDSTHSWSMSLFAPSIFFYLTGTIVWLAFASSKPQSFSESD
ncbi:putative anion transporter 6, chloroplastic isoform X1 [Gossypium australe]|uniref:Putative anion transporter 6, chloroplastic isoform X1 n=1 Tax=Gossypium australe TaxID=47621 RepID=A0A5B6X922_9ROSI|nr:putative anion transporter 6, chloroplastic isoform X1 [Gossypium australe]